MIDRRAFLATSAAAAAALPSGVRAASGPVLTPEQFGARGDGVTNDTAAFARLSAEVNRRGGGTVSLRSGRTYIVGAQQLGGGPYGWNAEPILDFENLAGALTILGNGARLRCQPGLRFGTFDLGSGARVDRPLPNMNKGEVATPYRAMIRAKNCGGAITIRNVELDGNADRLEVGGKFGDKGWQIPASGLVLIGNRSSELVDNVHSHHHALDGVTIIGVAGRSERSRLSRIISRYNGRQGLSITAGQAYDFADCDFSHTGRAAIQSAPGAGVDIEAERKGSAIRDLSFTRCSFLDNVGAGMLADSGDSADVRFSDCTFVGTSSWSAWPKKPGLAFDRCTFVGALVHVYGDPDPRRAARFVGCRFSDDPGLSPTRQVFDRGGKASILATDADSEMLFDGCAFTLVGNTVLPATRSATYRNCKLSQRSPRPAAPIGQYQGTTIITGPVNLAGSNVEGTLVVNGRHVPLGIVTPNR